MQLFLETASLEEVEEASELGVLDGVVTNPLLAGGEHVDYRHRIGEICRTVQGPVFVDLTTHLLRDMIEEATLLSALGLKVVVKLPTTKPGIKALKQLTKRGVSASMILCFSAAQALVAAKAGAAYISPSTGDRNDSPEEAMRLLARIRRVYGNYGLTTQVIAAPIRSQAYLVQAAMVGADAAAVPMAVIDQMLHHPLTELHLKDLMQQWKQVQPPLTVRRTAMHDLLEADGDHEDQTAE